jgi:hypothetical protein
VFPPRIPLLGTPGTAPRTQGLIPREVPMRSQLVPTFPIQDCSMFTDLFPSFPLFPARFSILYRS